MIRGTECKKLKLLLFSVVWLFEAVMAVADSTQFKKLSMRENLFHLTLGKDATIITVHEIYMPFLKGKLLIHAMPT